VKTSPRTVGIVGAGRTRVGLGPYFARDCQRAGLRLAGIAGRDAERTAALAERYAQQFGHPVAAHTDPSALARSVDALVVATPVEHHAEGLAAALAARVPCLVEKPLVAPAQAVRGLELVDGFAAEALLLVENCQWPFVLPTFDRLFPGARTGPARRVAMRLSPSAPGPEMLLDSLSHLLSVAQSVLPDDARLQLLDCALEDPRCAGGRNVLRARLGRRGGELELELELQVCASQPRPAWLAIDGRRIDRRIGQGYAFAFAAGERVLAADDPLTQSVAAFAEQVLRPDDLARARANRAIRERLSLYAAIVQRLGLAGE